MRSKSKAGTDVCSAKSSVSAPISQFQSASEIFLSSPAASTSLMKARRSSALWRPVSRFCIGSAHLSTAAERPGFGNNAVIHESFENPVTLFRRRDWNPFENDRQHPWIGDKRFVQVFLRVLGI